MGLNRTSTPAAIITPDECYQQLRVEGEMAAADAAIIASKLAAATQYVEDACNLQFCTATWEWSLDSFWFETKQPDARRAGYTGDYWAECYREQILRFPRWPITATSFAVSYVDGAGATQSLASTAYRLDVKAQPARLTPAFGLFWPVTQAVVGAVTITFTAGYGAASAVPEKAKEAVKVLLTHWWMNREMIARGVVQEIPKGFGSILNQMRVEV